MNEKPENTRPHFWQRRVPLYVWPVLVLGVGFLISLIIALIIQPRPWPLDWGLVGLGTTLVAGSLVLGLLVGLFYYLLRGCHRARFLFCIACAATAVALAYAEEDFRGWHTWHQFENQCRVKGIPLHLADVVPPAVPDDQNFAMTPIGFTAYGSILTRDGKVIPGEKRDPHFVERMRISRTSTVAAESSFSETAAAGAWTRGIFTKLDDWQGYYRRLAAKTNEFPVPPQPGLPAADVLLALSKFDSTIEELRTASRLPASRFPLSYDNESPASILLPHFGSLRVCVKTLQLRSAAELQNNEAAKALADVRLGLNLTEKVRNEPFLISHLVRLAMLDEMLQPVWEGLANHRWSEEQLAELDASLAGFDFVSDYRLCLLGELGLQTGEIDLVRRHPARSDLGMMTDRDGHNTGGSVPAALIVRCIPAGWYYQNEYRCARLTVEGFLPVADTNRHVFAPDLARQAQETLEQDFRSFSPFTLYEKIMLQAPDNGAKKFAVGQAAADLARTAVALERYRLAHAEFPETLDRLVPTYLVAVPRDVIGGQPLKYRRETGGRFVLYSVGWNQTDDGGKVGGKVVTKDGAIPPLDLSQGDWVWQYPPQ
jgi:hypothetical protein